MPAPLSLNDAIVLWREQNTHGYYVLADTRHWAYRATICAKGRPPARDQAMVMAWQNRQLAKVGVEGLVLYTAPPDTA